ncbi:MAG: hypothetical protein L0323_11800 [Planctomycetes bacterium]|nr:hypothetical protein [Planctomycetota bacterium]
MRGGGWWLLALPACWSSPPPGVPGALATGAPAEAPADPSATSLPVILPLPSDEPDVLAEIPDTLGDSLRRVARGFLVRFAAEAGLRNASRHVGAILLQHGDPDSLRAAAGLLRRPDPPPLLRAQGSPADAGALGRELLEPGSVPTASVALALARVLAVGPEDRLPLVQVLRTTDEPSPTLLLAIGRCGTPEDAVDVRPYLQAGTVQRRYAAAAAGAALGDARAEAWLRVVLEKGDASMRREVAVDLGLVGPSGLAEGLLGSALEDLDPSVAAPAALALLGTKARGAAARARLLEVGQASNLFVHPGVLRTLRPPPPAPFLAYLLLAPSFLEETRIEAALGLARRRDRLAGLLLRFLLERGEVPEVCLAAHALAALEGQEAALEALRRRVSGAPEGARAAAAFALGEVGGAAAAEALARALPRGDPAAAAAFLGAAAGSP